MNEVLLCWQELPVTVFGITITKSAFSTDESATIPCQQRTVAARQFHKNCCRVTNLQTKSLADPAEYPRNRVRI